MLPSLSFLLAYNARHYPGRAAAVIDGRSLTFGQLAREVDDAASRLAPWVGAGDRLAIWLPNGMAWIVLFLAAARLGVVVVPISTRLTVAEVDGILRDCRPTALATTRGYRGRNYYEEAADLSGEQPALIDADERTPAAHWVVERKASRPTAPPVESPLLCIQYTSGTAGVPKGVMITESAYVMTAAYAARCQTLTPETRFVSAAPFFHCSGSMHAITACLVAGCTLYGMSIWDAQEFLDLVQGQRCNASHGIFWKDVLLVGESSARSQLATLKIASAIGSPAYIQRLRDALGLEGVASLYGMTETGGNYSMWYPDDPFEKRSTASGRPQPGNQIRTVDPDTARVCSADETGEIQLKGPTVTPGYFARAEATSDAFTGDGWLRTGDLGRLSPQGELTYVARLKEIVRTGGENVSPLEIEELLQELSGIQQLCVVGIPDDRLGEVLAVVIASEQEFPWAHLREAMTRRISSFKIPRAVYRCDRLPTTSATNRVQRGLVRQSLSNGNYKKVV